MESKTYITSKSKTFKEGTNTTDVAAWVLSNIETFAESGPIGKAAGKYKITITNLK